ncbi:unnamed protein product [Calicophoron daubneyi]|uniref:One cut domain family member n=1 Tax=Calicophoron daubneyi TaxID=300641 RepID=A0AAV2T2P5_CALDB
MLGQVHILKEELDERLTDGEEEEEEEEEGQEPEDESSSLYFLGTSKKNGHVTITSTNLNELNNSVLSIAGLAESAVDCSRLNSTLPNCSSESILSATAGNENPYYSDHDQLSQSLMTSFQADRNQESDSLDLSRGRNSDTEQSPIEPSMSNYQLSDLKSLTSSLSELPASDSVTYAHASPSLEANNVSLTNERATSLSTRSANLTFKSNSSPPSPHHLDLPDLLTTDNAHLPHTQMTNESEETDMNEEIPAGYLANDEAVIQSQQSMRQIASQQHEQQLQPQQQRLREQSLSETDLNFLSEPPNGSTDSTSMSNYTTLTAVHALPSINSVSDHFTATRTSENTNSVDSTVAAAAGVMSYMQQHGPINYGMGGNLKSMNCLESKSFTNWGAVDFELSHGNEPNLYRDHSAYNPLLLPNGQRIPNPNGAVKTHLGPPNSITPDNNLPLVRPYSSAVGELTTDEMSEVSAPPLQTVQMRGNNGVVAEAVNFRPSQPQMCYTYTRQEMDLKPELKGVINTAQLPHGQGPLPAHPSRTVVLGGPIGPQHLPPGPMGLPGGMPVMHPHRIAHPMQEMEEINTKALAQRISAELKRYSIPQAVFAQRVLCRSQGTLSDLLRNPKPWSKLKSGRETFRRMWKWLQEPEFQRMSALRLAACKRKDLEHTKQDEGRQPKKPRLVFTDIQRRTLHAIFKETKRPSKEMQSTIAQQLGLEVSTVANFFMNARRRSLDKWQEDVSKASSLAETPSPGSPSSRSGHLNRSNSANVCEIGQANTFSPGPRRPPGNTVTFSTPGSELGYPVGARNDFGRITRAGSLGGCNNLSIPPGTPSLGQSLGCGNNLFNAVHRSAVQNPAFLHSNTQTNLSSHCYNNGSISEAANNYSSTPLHGQNVGHSPHQLSQAHLHQTPQQFGLQQAHSQQFSIPQQQPRQLFNPVNFLERGENHTSAPIGNGLGPSLLREPAYRPTNAQRPHPAFAFPPSGLHPHQSVGAPHLGLFHPGMNSAAAVRNHFLMRDFPGGAQFDHSFLNTMSSGQRVLTEQALELCSSLAAANAASLSADNVGGESANTNGEFSSGPQSKSPSAELNKAVIQEKGDSLSDDRQSSGEQTPNPSHEQIDEATSIPLSQLDGLRQNYFSSSELTQIKGDIAGLNDSICGLVSSDDADLSEELNGCDSDQS